MYIKHRLKRFSIKYQFKSKYAESLKRFAMEQALISPI